MYGKSALAILCVTVTALVAACGPGAVPASSTARPASTLASAAARPPGVIPAARACGLVVGREPRGFFTRVEQVHLVLTTYAQGEPIEAQGDISAGMPPGTMVWVVEIHAEAIHWDHSTPAGYVAPAQPYTDYSVVMNARTGQVTDSGECRCWPLPLGQAGPLISLPARC
jgi:hypothetical protein